MERSVIYSIPTRKDAHANSHPLRRASFEPATIFTPLDGNLAPEVHFPLQIVFAPDRPPYPRFVNRFNNREILLVVDGSCVNNGRHADKSAAPVAACSFLFKAIPSHCLDLPPTPVTFPFRGVKDQEALGSIAFRLEREGPAGDPVEHTSNRAKLRAVIAALQFRPWDAEGWGRVVILTDLEYLVSGATKWLARWVDRQWTKPGRDGRAYSNRDLWEVLQDRIEELRFRGCEVSFWLVSSADERGSRFIREAKEAAREAARSHPEAQVDKFTKLCALML